MEGINQLALAAFLQLHREALGIGRMKGIAPRNLDEQSEIHDISDSHNISNKEREREREVCCLKSWWCKAFFIFYLTEYMIIEHCADDCLLLIS